MKHGILYNVDPLIRCQDLPDWIKVPISMEKHGIDFPMISASCFLSPPLPAGIQLSCTVRLVKKLGMNLRVAGNEMDHGKARFLWRWHK